MAQLADVYLGACAHSFSQVLAPADISPLEESLVSLCARGHAAHPAIALADDAFAAHLGRCGAPVGVAGADVHAEDLFLCCAALHGDDAAVRTLRAGHRGVLADYLRRVDPTPTPAFLDEVERRLWDGALRVTADGPAKLASYAGKGPLAGWLGVVAQRIALAMAPARRRA